MSNQVFEPLFFISNQVWLNELKEPEDEHIRSLIGKLEEFSREIVVRSQLETILNQLGQVYKDLNQIRNECRKELKTAISGQTFSNAGKVPMCYFDIWFSGEIIAYMRNIFVTGQMVNEQMGKAADCLSDLTNGIPKYKAGLEKAIKKVDSLLQEKIKAEAERESYESGMMKIGPSAATRQMLVDTLKDKTKKYKLALEEKHKYIKEMLPSLENLFNKVFHATPHHNDHDHVTASTSSAATEPFTDCKNCNMLSYYKKMILAKIRPEICVRSPEMNEKDYDLGDVKQDNESKDKEIKTLGKKLEELEDAVQDRELDVSGLQEVIANRDGQVKEIGEAKHLLEKKLDQLKNEIQVHAKSEESKDKEIKTLEKKLKELEDAVQDRELAVSGLQEAKQLLEEKLDQLKNEIQEHAKSEESKDKEIKTLEKKLKELEDAVQDRELAVSGLQEALPKRDGQIKEIEVAKQLLEEKLDRLKNEIQEHEKSEESKEMMNLDPN